MLPLYYLWLEHIFLGAFISYMFKAFVYAIDSVCCCLSVGGGMDMLLYFSGVLYEWHRHQLIHSAVDVSFFDGVSREDCRVIAMKLEALLLPALHTVRPR